MAVGLLALVMLVVVPILLRQYTRPIWREMTDNLEPTRGLVNNLQASLPGVNQFPGGGPAPIASAEQIQIQQADFEAALEAAYRLEDAINREIDRREADIERLERLDVRITGGLVLVAMLAALGAAVGYARPAEDGLLDGFTPQQNPP